MDTARLGGNYRSHRNAYCVLTENLLADNFTDLYDCWHAIVEVTKFSTATFIVGEYINYRNDINRPFSGFEVKELKK
jgi:hypothetical protein